MAKTGANSPSGEGQGILDSVGDVIRHWGERITSPFFGPFTVAWAVWNWRFLALMSMSNDPVKSRIEDAMTWYISWVNMLFVPAMGAVIYMVISPILNLIPQITIDLGEVLKGYMSGLFVGWTGKAAEFEREKRRAAFIKSQPRKFHGDLRKITLREIEVELKAEELKEQTEQLKKDKAIQMQSVEMITSAANYAENKAGIVWSAHEERVVRALKKCIRSDGPFEGLEGTMRGVLESPTFVQEFMKHLREEYPSSVSSRQD